MKKRSSIIAIICGLIASFILGGFLAGIVLKRNIVHILNSNATSQIVILHHALRTADEGDISATQDALATALRSTLYLYEINTSIDGVHAADDYVRDAHTYLYTRDVKTEQGGPGYAPQGVAPPDP